MTEKKPEFIKRDITAIGKDYASLLKTLKERYRSLQIKTAVTVNTAMLEFYWALGRDLSKMHGQAKWGSAFFDTLSLDLRKEFPDQKGFSTTNLKYAKRWYEFYSQADTIRQRPVDEFTMPSDFGFIPWGQHIEIFTHCKNIPEAQFYVNQTIANKWSRPELASQIKSDLYFAQGAAVTNFKSKLPAPQSKLAQEILKSPYHLGFTDLPEHHSERQLENALASNITRFLLELGQGFAYVGRQMELRMPSGQVFMPDMVFYHTRLKCYVVIELKVTKFIPDYVGQLNFYVSAVDELMKQADDNPTIGLLICKSKDNTVVEWSFRGLSRPLGVAEYELNKVVNEVAAKTLPTETELQKLIDTYEV